MWEEDELTIARSALRSSLRAMEDSAGALEDFAMGQMATGSDETISGIMAALEQVTPQRIQDAAASVRLDTIYFLKGKEGCGDDQ